MRQLGDTLVWLGLIVVVAGVVYFTPRLARFMASEQDVRDGLKASKQVVLNYRGLPPAAVR